MSEMKLEQTLSALLGNDDIMSKISDILSSHNGDTNESIPDVISLLSSVVGEQGEPSTEEAPDAAVGNNVGTKGLDMILSGVARSSALLCALRPYLNEKRGQMIDSILKIEKITQIMKLAR